MLLGNETIAQQSQRIAMLSRVGILSQHFQCLKAFFWGGGLNLYSRVILPLTFFESGRDGESQPLCETHQWVASHTCPNWGWNLQLRYMPFYGIEPVTLSARRAIFTH